MPTPTGFHHVAIKVHNFDKSVAMYTALGFKEKARWGEGDSRGVMLDTGSGDYLEIFAGGPATPFVPLNTMHAAGPILHFAIRTTDVPAAVKAAEAAGFITTVPPKTITIPSSPVPIPVTLAFIQGPDGELLEFIDNSVT